MSLEGGRGVVHDVHAAQVVGHGIERIVGIEPACVRIEPEHVVTVPAHGHGAVTRHTDRRTVSTTNAHDTGAVAHGAVVHVRKGLGLQVLRAPALHGVHHGIEVRIVDVMANDAGRIGIGTRPKGAVADGGDGWEVGHAHVRVRYPVPGDLPHVAQRPLVLVQIAERHLIEHHHQGHLRPLAITGLEGLMQHPPLGGDRGVRPDAVGEGGDDVLLDGVVIELHALPHTLAVHDERDVPVVVPR